MSNSFSNDSEQYTAKDMFKEHGLWLKRAPEGSFSLMKALSNALYFSDVYYETLQRQVFDFLVKNPEYSANFESLKSIEGLQMFFQNPGLPEFESVNLELAGNMLKTRIKLFFVSELSLCTDLYYQKTKKSIKIFRAGDNHYEAIFPSEFKNSLAFCQNIVLNIQDNALDSNKIDFVDINQGNYINFEYENWLLFSFKKFNPFNKQVAGEGGIEFPTKQSKGLAMRTSDSDFEDAEADGHEDPMNIGSQIISIFNERKLEAKNRPCLLSVEKNQESKLTLNPLTVEEIVRYINDFRLSQDANNEDNEWSDDFQGYLNSEFFEESQIGKYLELEIPLNDIGRKKSADQSNNAEFEDVLNEEVDEMPNGQFKHEINQVMQSLKAQSPKMNRRRSQMESVSPDKNFLHLMAQRQNTAQPNADLEIPKEAENEISNFEAKPKSNLKEKMRQKMANKNIPTFEKPQTPKQQTPNKNEPQQKTQPNAETETEEQIPANGHKVAFKGEAEGQSSNKKKGQHPKPGRGEAQGSGAGIMDPTIYEGQLKFFDDKNNFGFITASIKNVWEDIFVYGSEFQKSKVDPTLLLASKYGAVLNFHFNVVYYTGKYQRSKKAINLELIV